MKQRNIMILDESRRFCKVLARTLEERGYYVAAVFSWEEVEEHACRMPIDIILLVVQDVNTSNLSQLSILKKMSPAAEVIVISPQYDQAVSMEAMKYGALDYFFMPLNVEALFQSMDQSLNDKIFS